MARFSRAICSRGGQGTAGDPANAVELKLNPVYMDIALGGQSSVPPGGDPAGGAAYVTVMRQF
eukprot:13787123-Alexandrium_andersonii.AAC.1